VRPTLKTIQCYQSQIDAAPVIGENENAPEAGRSTNFYANTNYALEVIRDSYSHGSWSHVVHTISIEIE
jgi:hypothetical protein